MTSHRKIIRRKKSSMLQLTEWTVHLKENSRNRQLMDTTAHRYSSTVIESEKKNPQYLLKFLLI